MTDVFLVGGTRTPIGRFAGGLSTVRPDDLAALVIAETVARSGVPTGAIDSVLFGAANQAGEDNRNVARMALLLAGLPDEIPGITVNQLCASGLASVMFAAQAIKAGEADVILAGGVESMTRAPWVQAKPERAFAKPGEISDTSIGWRFVNPRLAQRDKATLTMPETAEEVADLDGISRADADEFAMRSHVRALAAQDAGRFAGEIVAVPTNNGDILHDEGPRPDSNLKTLSGLRSVVRPNGVVTAGNSSSLNDGAAAILVASEQAVKRYGLTPRARVLGGASAGVAPEIMGLGPVPATRKLLNRLGLTVQDLGAVELNEAFATQSLACIRRLGLDPETVNADGGAIALGHPLGASGTRILITLLGRMEREDAHRGLATMCVGVGQGAALAVERA
ncbi:acetyl-CoA C-acyltransferase [Pseudarthrobacter sp. SSS035]|uniref:acetyl-CoA C-acyltransferase n=1 Tax=Pseudarthrobacter sp. SSS035 TaxID=2931399 RepID=UPI00200EE002|nr:acetyl-CoA C-acyltransferase [Pseudarthrobacter sp. SSS035]